MSHLHGLHTLANAVLLLLAGDLIGHGNTSSTYFAGIGHNHTWTQDADAGTVLQCSKVFSSLQNFPLTLVS
jgi:hypothetical protein